MQRFREVEGRGHRVMDLVEMSVHMAGRVPFFHTSLIHAFKSILSGRGKIFTLFLHINLLLQIIDEQVE